MRGREAKRAQSADLLVCFPSRAHLTLMPKAICSPSRPSDSNKRHHMKKSSMTMHASPLMWAKTKQMGCDISEPTSPKVTCAGQVKIKHKGRPCKTWQSVMEEIERMHNNKKKKKPSWAEAFGFKKEALQFLACLRNIKFDFRCFGAFPVSDIISEDDDDEDEDDNYQENQVVGDDNDEASKAVFSKWLMVLDENDQDSDELYKDEEKWSCDDGSVGAQAQPCVPPANALLLMRCRSAPAKSWLKEQDGENVCDSNKERARGRQLSLLMEEEKKEEERLKKEEESLVLGNYDTEYYNISTDIAKETWVIGGLKDLLSRSRSWRR